MGHQTYVLLCTETTLSNHPAVIPKSSCDVHLLRSPWVSTGAKGAWHPHHFWTVLSGTHGFWQFYYIMLCFTLKIWGFTSVGSRCFKYPTRALICHNDELRSSLSWLDCLLTDSEVFILGIKYPRGINSRLCK